MLLNVTRYDGHHNTLRLRLLHGASDSPPKGEGFISLD